MGVLDTLSQGLRGMGGVASPSVYNVQRQEEQTALDRTQRNKELTLGVLVKGAESGSISPEKFQALVQKLGMDLPAMGPSVNTQLDQFKLGEAQDLKRREAEFDQPEAPPPGTAIPDGALPPTETIAEQTPFDVFVARAHRADKLGLKDQFERNSKLADLELKQRERKSGLGQLIAERDALPPDDPKRKFYDAAIGKETTTPPKNSQFVELPTGKMVNGKPEFQNYVVNGQNEDGTPKLVPQGAAAAKGSLVDVSIKGEQKQFENEQKMKDDFVKESQTFVDVRDGYTRMKSALSQKDITAASTLAGATSFMKLLDPGSVVRESELGMAMAATGAIDRALNYYNVLKKGKVLTESQRKDFLAIGEQLYKAAAANQKGLEEKYRADAKDYNLNPDRVVKSYDIKETKAPEVKFPPVDQREVGTIYDTPKGPLKWNGSNWEEP